MRKALGMLPVVVLAGCASAPLVDVAAAEFSGQGIGRDEQPAFACDGEGRIDVQSATPEGWLSVSLTDSAGAEVFGQVFDEAPSEGRSSGTFSFQGKDGAGWRLVVERHDYADNGRFEGNYAVQVAC